MAGPDFDALRGYSGRCGGNHAVVVLSARGTQGATRRGSVLAASQI